MLACWPDLWGLATGDRMCQGFVLQRSSAHPDGSRGCALEVLAAAARDADLAKLSASSFLCDI